MDISVFLFPLSLGMNLLTQFQQGLCPLCLSTALLRRDGHIKGPDFFFLRGLLGNRLTTSLGLRSRKVQSRFCHPWANSATVVTSSRGLKGHRLLIGLGFGKSAGGMRRWQPAFTHSGSIKRIRSGLVNPSWILIWFWGFCPHVGQLGQLQILLRGTKYQQHELITTHLQGDRDQGSEAPSWEALEGISRRRELRVTDSAGSGSLASSAEEKGQHSCWPHSMFSVLRQEFVTMAWKPWVPSSP